MFLLFFMATITILIKLKKFLQLSSWKWHLLYKTILNSLSQHMLKSLLLTWIFHFLFSVLMYFFDFLHLFHFLLLFFLSTVLRPVCHTIKIYKYLLCSLWNSLLINLIKTKKTFLSTGHRAVKSNHPLAQVWAMAIHVLWQMQIKTMRLWVGKYSIMDSNYILLALQNRSVSMVDMYIDNSEPTENVGQIQFSLEYDFQNTTLILKVIQVSIY